VEPDLKQIFERFASEATFMTGKAFGNGHIHDTYLIVTTEKDKDNFILQRLNTNVFRNIPELQNNIERITAHIRKKLSRINDSDLKRECLTLIPSKEGSSWINDEKGNPWRLYIYIRDHRSYDTVNSPDIAYEAGKAIGRFQSHLADLPGEPLYETIPSFHDLGKRLDYFLEIRNEDPAKRAEGAKGEIEFILKRSEEMMIIHRLGKSGKIPVRITHNDTKLNNVLFDENDKSMCIIDLDTVMPGFFHSDFGDTIRTGANIAAEDERDLSLVRMDITLFRAFAEGYLSETKGILKPVEKEHLPMAPLVMTYEQAMRFLADHIAGDIYYKIHHDNHNLERARAQIRLLKNMEEQYGEMKKIVEEIIRH